ncbi:trypsin-like peptidase domain-containing protein [Pseudomonadales bacterium]|nr:trypsin-like peptidase domain-containing protein [Pseudomonadales bacterium]
MQKFSIKPFIWPVLFGIMLAVVILQARLLQQHHSRPTSSDLDSMQAPTMLERASFADAVARAIPSVVNIYTTRVIATQQHPLLNDPVFRRFLGERAITPKNKITRGLGSGVIVDGDGHILTNHHVINEADRIRVMLNDGRERDAILVGSDLATDIAVLKIELDDLQPAAIADPNSVRIGDVVLAIGNPYGIGQTVTQGIVSAIGRYGLNLNTYESYIQTDAAINKGNSGGALINTAGLLIGINSALFSQSGESSGIGFAIPNDITQHALQQIINTGEVTRGWLGISGEEITPSQAEYFGLNIQRGLMITGLVKNGPADAAGLLNGDIITHIDGERMGSGNASMHKIGQTNPGATINISVFRNGATQNVLVTIGKKPTRHAS